MGDRANLRQSGILLALTSLGAAFGASTGYALGGYPHKVVVALLAMFGAIAAFLLASLILYTTADERAEYSWKANLSVVPLFVLLVAWLIYSMYPFIRHKHVRERMQTTITKLATQKPAVLTDDQWAYCIFHTWNLHANYGSAPSSVPTADLERIERELQVRIDRGPDVETVDWIWDQYMQSYPRARNYERWRPTAPSNKADFENPQGYDSLSSWRSKYNERVGN